jgi:uncharacterized membrane protein YdbT with pleckstrin-like domain
MAYPDALLSRGERVVVHKHPSWKVLIAPSVWFVLIIAAAFTAAALMRRWEDHVLGWWITAAVAVVLLVLLVLVPFLRWRTEHFVITNHHIFFRTGILNRTEHRIPLIHVQNMQTEVTFLGRLLGYGTLIVESAADQPLRFRNVASLPTVQHTLNQLIMDDRDRYRGGSGGPAAAGPVPAEPERG